MEKNTQEAKPGQGAELFWKQRKDMVGGGVGLRGWHCAPRSHARAGHGRAGSRQVGAGHCCSKTGYLQSGRVSSVPLSSSSSRANKEGLYLEFPQPWGIGAPSDESCEIQNLRLGPGTLLVPSFLPLLSALAHGGVGCLPG